MIDPNTKRATDLTNRPRHGINNETIFVEDKVLLDGLTGVFETRALNKNQEVYSSSSPLVAPVSSGSDGKLHPESLTQYAVVSPVVVMTRLGSAYRMRELLLRCWMVCMRSVDSGVLTRAVPSVSKSRTMVR